MKNQMSFGITSLVAETDDMYIGKLQQEEEIESSSSAFL
jgi:hypothetical protein